MLQDLRHAYRSLRQSPAVTVVIVVTLALGIGLNTSIFSVVHGILLRPLDYPDPGRLMTLWETSPDLGVDQEQVSGGNFSDWREGAGAFEEMAAWRRAGHALGGPDGPERVETLDVTPSLFSLLDVPPARGRALGAADAASGNEYLAVLSHAFWERRFGGDPGVVGHTIVLDGEPYTVVGVMPAGFEFPPADGDVALWTPLHLEPDMAALRAHRMYDVVGRLAPEAGVDRAQQQLDAIAARVSREFPDSNRGWGVRIVPAHEQLVGDARPLLLLLGGAAGLVLLIGCVNIANVLLARSARKQKEFAIRASLGAGRRELLRRSVAETLALAGAGGAAGLLAAFWGVSFLRGVIPADVPRVDEVGVDPAVLGFAVAASLGAALVFGLVPALRAMRPRLVEVLQEGGRSPSGGRRSRRLLHVMVGAQVGLAVILLVSAGLLARSFGRLLEVDPGFRPDGVVSVSVTLPETTYPDRAAQVAFYHRLLDEVKAIPGAEAAGAVTALPMSPVGQDFDLPLQIPGRDAASPTERPRADYRAVLPGYFEAMGIPLVQGRLLDEFDRRESRPVMVVNETMARRFFPDVDPLGRRLGVPMAGEIEIVGVVADVRHQGLSSEPRPEIFVAYEQFPLREMHLVVRTAAEPPGVIRAVRERIRGLDPALPATGAATLAELLEGSLARPRFNMVLVSALALCALVLAAVGVYGVISYSVAQRRAEIGIRMALGAGARDTAVMVGRQALVFVAAGLGVGMAGSLVAGRLLEGFLFGVAPTDPTTLIGVTVVLALVALASAALPARRAAAVDPLTTLRRE